MMGPECSWKTAAQGSSRSATRRSTDRKSGLGTWLPGAPRAIAVTAAGALRQQRNPGGSCDAYSRRSSTGMGA